MDKLNYLNTGTLISDEAITVTGSAQYLAHDCWNNLELWTGEGGTGTQLTVDTDYTISGYDAYNHGYNTVAVINAAYEDETLYATYESLGDYVDADDVNSKADKVTTPTAGNFAGLNASGNLTDSGSKATDFATSGHSHSNASAEAAGFMSADDKTKLTGIAENANNYTHPNHSGDVTSVGDGATTIANDAVTNAKLANMAVNTIKGRITASTGDPEDLTATQVRTIINVADGAEVNQNAFSTVAVSGQSNVVADSKTDTLTFVAGTNITITTDAGADSITINASGGTASSDFGAL